MRHLFNPMFIKHSMIGYTIKYVCIFLLLYYFIFVIQYFGFPSKYCEYCSDGTNKTTTKPFGFVYRENFCKSVKNWAYENPTHFKVLYFFLGFFSKLIMMRWMTQITYLPRISDVAVILNGVVAPGI